VLLFQFFVATPPVASAFISGFLAPRASYLAGLITALVAIACLAVASFASPGLDASLRQQLLVQALVISPASGALYAAAAAWYKRFLELANPNRRKQQTGRRGNQGPVRSRPAQRRR
jgi:hypothetical protein